MKLRALSIIVAAGFSTAAFASAESTQAGKSVMDGGGVMQMAQSQPKATSPEATQNGKPITDKSMKGVRAGHVTPDPKTAGADSEASQNGKKIMDKPMVDKKTGPMTPDPKTTGTNSEATQNGKKIINN